MESDPRQRINSILDGDEPRGEFSLAEFRELELQKEICSETQKLYRSLPAPDLTANVIARLSEKPLERPARQGLRHFIRTRIAWAWIPQPIRLRPASVVIFTCAVVFLGFLSGRVDLLQTTPSGVATAPVNIFVQFRLEAPQASAVHLGGSFTEWKPAYALHELSPGIWSVVVPLEPGVHDYSFLVNGRWITDPVAPLVDDGFGGTNSRLLVVAPTGTSRL